MSEKIIEKSKAVREEALRRYVWAFHGMSVDEYCMNLLKKYNEELEEQRKLEGNKIESQEALNV